MLPDLSVPPHWPEQRRGAAPETQQDAIKLLAQIRALIVSYRCKGVKDWRRTHARTADIIDVVNGVLADALAIDALHAAADKDATRLAEKNEELREKLAESKRPFSAQMEMQNRRIIALTAELDLLRSAVGKKSNAV